MKDSMDILASALLLACSDLVGDRDPENPSLMALAAAMGYELRAEGLTKKDSLEDNYAKNN